MLNTASRWDIFQETGIENNIENIVETETCRVLRLKGPGGEGLITIYNVFDGVYLMYNDCHMSRYSSYFSLPEELARRFDISTGALKSGFKSVYGSPIHTYTRAYRMNSAAELLTTHRKRRIIDIASSVEYDNPSKFTAAFKAQFGMTPVEYRGRTVGDTSHN